MAKASAKIVVGYYAPPWRTSSYPRWQVTVESDLPFALSENDEHESEEAALLRAHEWSRRLGGIPVEVEPTHESYRAREPVSKV